LRLRVTTWNANSVRIREHVLRRISAELNPDILCLQETKVEDGLFPASLFTELGYPHLYLHGQKAYHGVAILSRRPLENARFHKWCGVDHCRHAVVELEGGLEIHNLYVPAGGDLPDPAANPKFKHKLDMIAELTDFFAARKGDGRRVVLLGDLNIAPLENDVWSHRQLLDVVSHTPIETDGLDRLQACYGFVDAVRTVVPADRKLYTWWSYRARDWAASDRGRRLDHIWLSPALAPKLISAEVKREARGWESPSDHVPVTVDLEI
jgi:exodeoxyribonuclease III